MSSIYIRVSSMESFVARFDGRQYIASIGDEVYTSPLLSELVDVVDNLPFPGALDCNYSLTREWTEEVVVLPFDNVIEAEEFEFDDSIPF